MESNREDGSLDLRLLETNRSHSPPDRLSGSFEVDASVNLPLQISNSALNMPTSLPPDDNELVNRLSTEMKMEQGSRESIDMEIDTCCVDGMIPYMDEDDDQALHFVVPSYEENEGQDISSLICNNRRPPPMASLTIFKEYTNPNYTQYKSTNTDAIFADLDETASFLPNSRNSDEVEHAKSENLRHHISNYLQNATSDREKSLASVGLFPKEFFNEDLKDDYNSFKSTNDESAQTVKNENGSTCYTTRNGKLVRRRKPDEKNVFQSHEVDGYRGNDDLTNVLVYIEGPEALKKIQEEEQVKKAKKKSMGVSVVVDHNNQKKDNKIIEEESSTTTDHDYAAILTDDEQQQPIAEAAIKQRNDSGDIRDADALLAEKLQREEDKLALNKDLGPSKINSQQLKKEKFVKVFTRRRPPPPQQLPSLQQPPRMDVRHWRIKRASTPPPAAVPRQWNVTGGGNETSFTNWNEFGERRRRNSYDYSSYCLYDNYGNKFTSTKDNNSSNKTTTYFPPQQTTNIGYQRSDKNIFMNEMEAELANISFSSADGEKLSNANITAAMNVDRTTMEENGEKTKENELGQNSAINIPMNDVVEEGKKTFVILPPLSKGGIDSSMAAGYEAMDFICTSPENVGKFRMVENRLPNLTGDKNEVLQMLFASCTTTNGDLSTGNIVRSDSPSVQFLGSTAAAQSNVAYNLSFVFGDSDDDDRVINALMTRSSIDDDYSPNETNPIMTSAQSESNLLNQSGMSIDICGKADKTELGDGIYSEKMYREMKEFMKKAWNDFNIDPSLVTYYAP